jgi:alpha-galactosidase
MEFRAIVSMMAHMGLEMDLAELTEQEQTVATHYVQLYKQHRAWLHQSTQYQLTDFGLTISDSSQNSQSIIQYVNTGNLPSETSAAFMVIACQLTVNKDESTAAVRLQGLIPEQCYRLRVVNYDLSSNAAFREFQHPLMTDQGLVLEGDVLMKVGLRLPVLHPDSALVLLGERL